MSEKLGNMTDVITIKGGIASTLITATVGFVQQNNIMLLLSALAALVTIVAGISRILTDWRKDARDQTLFDKQQRKRDDE
ncbi:hypothetical protein [Thiothrix winogradskyi]|uniref:Holin n=1 Tax=Thiothrix winogradskyi TaxID=96472 RepID=A0ABY3T7L6_9GAMM|nr:hypothetical protein [Thiothrix winogradskyi]UJS26273.1 hypothetical protein L2Y54_09600 [Thiothrix winogradskyi]